MRRLQRADSENRSDFDQRQFSTAKRGHRHPEEVVDSVVRVVQVLRKEQEKELS